MSHLLFGKNRLVAAVVGIVAIVLLLVVAVQGPSAGAASDVPDDAQQCRMDGAVADEATATSVIEVAESATASNMLLRDVDWSTAFVEEATEGKYWVSVRDGDIDPVAGGKFHRLAVDQDVRQVVNVQTYIVGAADGAGVARASLLSDGELLWSGQVDDRGNVTTDIDSPMNPEYQTMGWCEWAVGALCGTGGGVACYGACAALGFANGIAGLSCAAVCGLISALGCTGATAAICG